MAKGQIKILTKDILPIMSDLYSFKNQGFAIYKRPFFLSIVFIIPILIVDSMYLYAETKGTTTY